MVNKKILIAIIGIAIIAGSAGIFLANENKTQNSNKSSESKNIIIKAPTPIGTTAYAYGIADKKGWFKEEGIELQYTGPIYGGPDSMLAVATGANDITIGTHISAIINGAAQGIDLKLIVASNGISPQVPGKWFVRNDSGIKTAKDLVGKKVGVNTLKASLDYTISDYLRQNGLSRDDVQILVLPQQAVREQAFRQGQIDLTSGDDKFLTFPEGGGARVLFTTYSVYKRYMATSGILFSNKFIKENPEAVRKFVRAYVRALDWSAENPDEARELIKEILKENQQNPELAAYWPGFGTSEHGIIGKEDVQYWINKFVEDGTLKEGQVGVDQIYTNEFNPYYKR